MVNLLIDTTYFGRNFGVMVFKDSILGTILLVQFVKQETNQLYLQGVQEIARRGVKIQSIICDGRKGLVNLFEGIPVQYCQFHQVKTIRTYLTKKPKLGRCANVAFDTNNAVIVVSNNSNLLFMFMLFSLE